MAYTCEDCHETLNNHTIVSVDTVCEVVDYTIPSFPFLTVKLQHIKFRLGSDSPLYDGYIRAEKVAPVSEECLLKVCFGYTNAFLIPQAVNQSIDTADLTLIDATKVFVIWKWEALCTSVGESHSLTPEENKESADGDVVPESECSGDDEFEPELIHIQVHRNNERRTVPGNTC